MVLNFILDFFSSFWIFFSFSSSTKEPNTELLNLINNNFYSKFTEIKKQKIAKNTKIFSKELSQILKQRVELIDFNTDELDEKLKNIQKDEKKSKMKFKTNI